MNLDKDRVKQIVVSVILILLGIKLFDYGLEVFNYVPLKIIAINAGIALLPVAIWLQFVYTKKANELTTAKEKRKQILVMLVVFILGILTAPILGMYYNYVQTGGFDYYMWLYDAIVAPAELIVRNAPQGSTTFEIGLSNLNKLSAVYETLTIVIDAWLEEILKVVLLIVFLRTFKLVNTIGDAVTYSVLAGLGFAFIENVVFFVDIYIEPTKGPDVYRSVVVFRSIVLNVAHMIFSGIFGYFYGLSKFGLPVFEEQRWEGEHFPLTSFISSILRIPKFKSYSALLFLEGMLLAMLIHAAFNIFLWFGLRDYAIYLMMASGVYVYYLTQRKAGHLVLATLGKRRLSLMAPKDEDVVLELAGMWINEGKYKEVEEICERLEKKDPDNAVIKLLYARAHDKRRVKRAQLALASLFFQEDIFEEDKSIFEHWNEIRLKREAEDRGVDFPDVDGISKSASVSSSATPIKKTQEYNTKSALKKDVPIEKERGESEK